MSTVTIPGALADHLTGQTIADAETVAALDAARRGRGRTLVIKPTSTRVLHVISAYAAAILENRTLHTPAKVRAARLWIQRAGHAVPTPAAVVEQPVAEQAAPVATNAVEQGAADLPDNLADTVTCPTCHVPAGARCITRAGKPAREPHGRRFEALEQAAGITRHRATARREQQARGAWPTLDGKAEGALLVAYAARINARAHLDDDQALAAEARLDQVEAETAEEFERSARAVDAVEHAEHAEAAVATVADAEALYAAQLVTEAEATEGTWQGAWIGEHQAADVLFVVDGSTEQGALFDGRAAQ